jgi:hypothetical protein
MKKTHTPKGPDKPTAKFVGMIWDQAHTTDANSIRLCLQDDKIGIYLGSNSLQAPDSNMFTPLVKEFLRYAVWMRWPWSKSINVRRCKVEAAGVTQVWSMSYDDKAKDLRINRD